MRASDLFASLPADEQAKRAMLERICAPAIGRYTGAVFAELEGQVVFGCSCCAPFEECPPTAVAAEPVVMDPGAVYPLKHWHAGSFTRAGAREVAATFEGCEPGAANRGGTIVLSEHGARLERVVYRSGVNPDACKVLPKRNQRDRLVCLWSDGQGSTNYTRLLLVDLAREDDVVEVASFDNDRACLLQPEPYVSIDVQDFELVDVNGDRQLDVVIQARSQSGVLREADLATCTDQTWVPTTVPTPVVERFVYLADGDGFVARSETAQRLTALYRDRDAHRGGRER